MALERNWAEEYKLFEDAAIQNILDCLKHLKINKNDASSHFSLALSYQYLHIWGRAVHH